jgi:hypothetical protein
MTDQIVHGTKAIESSAELAAEQRMDPFSVDRGCRDLQDAGGAHRRDQLAIGLVGLCAPREHDPYGVWSLAPGESPEELIRLGLQ